MATNLRSLLAMRQAAWACVPINFLLRNPSPGRVHFFFSTNSRYSSKRSPSAPSSENPPARRIPSTNSSFREPALTHLNESGDAHMVSISSKEVTSRTATAICRVIFSSPLAATLIRENRAKKGDVFAVARVAGIMAAKRTVDLIPLCHPVPISRVSMYLRLRSSGSQVALVEEGSQAETVKESQPWAGTGQGDAYKWHPNTTLTLEGDEDKSHQGTTQPTALTSKGPQAQQRAAGTEGSWVDIIASVECDGKTGVEMEALTAASVAALTVYDMCKAVDKGIRIENLRVVHKSGGKSGTWKDGVSVG